MAHRATRLFYCDARLALRLIVAACALAAHVDWAEAQWEPLPQVTPGYEGIAPGLLQPSGAFPPGPAFSPGNAGAQGQVLPLYSTGPDSDRVTPAGYPSELSQPLVPEKQPSATPPPPPGAKPGAFQQLAVAATWIPAGSSGFGMSDWLVQATFALPCPTPTSPLVLTPAFQAYYLQGPVGRDVPPRLYDASFQFRWMSKVSERWGVDVAFTPGWHGDFEHSTSDAFRIPARALAAYDWDPYTQVIVGVVYLDRDDVNWLPAAGLIWKPSDDVRWELVIPRPRVAKRISMLGDTEDWIYLATEFGGGSYAIQHTDGTHDVMTMSDYRLIGGLERKVVGGINTRLELGFVFARNVEFRSSMPDVSPDPTALIRLGATY